MLSKDYIVFVINLYKLIICLIMETKGIKHSYLLFGIVYLTYN